MERTRRRRRGGRPAGGPAPGVVLAATPSRKVGKSGRRARSVPGQATATGRPARFALRLNPARVLWVLESTEVPRTTDTTTSTTQADSATVASDEGVYIIVARPKAIGYGRTFTVNGRAFTVRHLVNCGTFGADFGRLQPAKQQCGCHGLKRRHSDLFPPFRNNKREASCYTTEQYGNRRGNFNRRGCPRAACLRTCLTQNCKCVAKEDRMSGPSHLPPRRCGEHEDSMHQKTFRRRRRRPGRQKHVLSRCEVTSSSYDDKSCKSQDRGGISQGVGRCHHSS
jgi:hypothetical protein